MDEILDNLKEAEQLLTDMLKNGGDTKEIQKTLDTIRATIKNLEARNIGAA